MNLSMNIEWSYDREFLMIFSHQLKLTDQHWTHVCDSFNLFVLCYSLTTDLYVVIFMFYCVTLYVVTVYLYCKKRLELCGDVDIMWICRDASIRGFYALE